MRPFPFSSLLFSAHYLKSSSVSLQSRIASVICLFHLVSEKACGEFPHGSVKAHAFTAFSVLGAAVRTVATRGIDLFSLTACHIFNLRVL